MTSASEGHASRTGRCPWALISSIAGHGRDIPAWLARDPPHASRPVLFLNLAADRLPVWPGHSMARPGFTA